MAQTQEPRTSDLIAKNLRALRVEAKLSQEELAARSGVSRLTITHLEGAQKSGVMLSTLQALAKALGVGLDALLAKPGRAAGTR